MIDERDFYKYPLCVDLDGTLWPGDCLFVCIKEFIKKYPLKTFKILQWWMNDITTLKSMVLKDIDFPVHKVTTYHKILDYLGEMKSKGANIFLITGSDQLIATKVAVHIGIFDDAFGSANGVNLVGPNKADFLNQKFGKQNYIYFGNEWKDRFVWQDSAAAVAVNVPKKAKLWLEQSRIYSKFFNC